VAIGWHVYSATGRALDLGYVGLSQFAPAALLSLAGGHVADRFDRRNVLAIVQSVYALASLTLLVAAVTRPTSVAPVYVVSVLLGAARAFGGPAGQALLPSLVPPEHFGSAVAWSSSLWQLATILGPALGGAVFALFGAAAHVYALAAALHVAATLVLLRIEPRGRGAPPKETGWADAVAGVRYVLHNRLLLGSISLDLFAVLLGGATALLPVFARDVLDVGPVGLGVLRSAPAAGAALVAIVIAYRPLRHRVGATMLFCVFLFGLATVGFGLSRSVYVSLACLAIAGGADMVSVVIRHTLVQLATPDEMRGRVSAVNMVFIGASNELGEFESGVTAALFGAVRAVVLGGIGTCVVVAAWTVAFPGLRRVDSLGQKGP
jgi:MFS family permease